MTTKRILPIICLLLLFCNPANAHKPSDAYVQIKKTESGIAGQVSIHLLDLIRLEVIDTDQNLALTWGELKAQENVLWSNVTRALQITSGTGGACILTKTDLLVEALSDGTYAVFHFSSSCSTSESLTIQYDLLFDIDSLHRGLLTFTGKNFSVSHVFSPDARDTRIDFSESGSSRTWTELVVFFKSGVWHIWIGFDHILFLITLLLPAAFLRKNRRWSLQTEFRPVLVDIIAIVTSFTIAHSITLSLVALGFIELSPSIVEPLIALSVTAAAVHNIFPLWHSKRWTLAFVFGLIHGFGFAGILAEAGIQPESILTPLLGFNVGVEAGQLLIVLAALPVIYFGSRLRVYKPVALYAGSFASAVIGILWFAERISG